MADSADDKQIRAGGQARSRLFTDQAQLVVFPMMVAAVFAAIIECAGQSEESGDQCRNLVGELLEFPHGLRDFYKNSEPPRVGIIHGFCASKIDVVYAGIERLTGQDQEAARKRARKALQDLLDQAMAAAVVAIPQTPGLGGCSV